MSADARFELRIENGGVPRQAFLLLPGTNRIGRLPGVNEVVLPWRGISRRHADLEVTDEGVHLRDLDSKNGTFLNGTPVGGAGATAAAGDEILIGPARLRLVEVGGATARLAFSLEDPRFTPPTARETATPSGDEMEARPTAGLRFPAGYIPGTAPALLAVYAGMEAVAASDLPVLLLGETGVGKEPLARALHASSPRRRGPFVALNSAAIPADLLEAELFGIGRGVATGVTGRPGRFELARGGTLFLDEIGDVPLPLQAKLLRALQEKEINPVGGAPVPLDARVVAATHADLREKVRAGYFRADLYYRLAGIVLEVPPLRERREDIPALVQGFVRASSREARKRVRGVTEAAREKLVGYDWPGNVRELEHEVRRLVYLCPEGQPVDVTHLAKEIREADDMEDTPEAAGSLRLDERLAELERRLIQEALERSQGNRTRAAGLLGISRNGLAIKMARLGLS